MILVVGATGVLGGMITRQLLAQGRDVCVLLRQNSPAEELSKKGMATSPQSLLTAGAKAAYGDLKDPDTLDWACDGIDTLITTANSSMRGGEDTVETVDRQGNQNLVKAAKAAGVKQFVFISFLGASLDNPLPFFRAKAETENFLRDSGLAYTILAPNYFMELWISMVVGIPLQAGLPITLVGKGERVHSFISIADVAAFACSVIAHPAAIDKRLALGGPEALTWRGIVAAFGKMLGRELPLCFTAPGEPIPGLPEMAPAVLAGMETYDSPIPMEKISGTFGVQMTPLASVLQRILNMPV